MTPLVNKAHQVIDQLFAAIVGEMQTKPDFELEDWMHSAKADSEDTDSAIHEVAAQFVYRCAEAVLQFRKQTKLTERTKP